MSHEIMIRYVLHPLHPPMRRALKNRIYTLPSSIAASLRVEILPKKTGVLLSTDEIKSLTTTTHAIVL